MDESERIRARVLEAAERLDRADAALDAALGRQAAYRSTQWWIDGKENPNAGPQPADGSPINEVIRWVTTSTPEQEEFSRRRRESWGTPLVTEWIEARDALYDAEFNGAIGELKAGRVGRGVEYAVSYFEADPWHFHSGYIKQDLARFLRRVQLSETHRSRLRKSLLAAITKGQRADLKEYVSLGRTLDTPEFRTNLRAMIANSDEGTAYRARRMLAACELNE